MKPSIQLGKMTFSRRCERSRDEAKAGVMRALIIASGILLTGCGKSEGIPEEAIISLAPTDFVETVTADGTVECDDPHYVYSILTLPVEEIFVKEGDKVSAGDLLCVLDTHTIEEQIEIQQASMALTQRTMYTNVYAAQHQYNVYNDTLLNHTDVNIVQAANNVSAAREACEAAQIRYANYKETLNLGMDPTLVSADQAVASASEAVQQARSMQAAVDDTDHVTDVEKEKAEDTVDSANLAYAQAIQQRDNLLRQSDLQLANYAKAVDDAMENFINANTAYEAAVRALMNARDLSSDAINRAYVTGDMSVEELKLAQLEQKLLDAQILADFSGTVTAVNIEPGQNSTGVLFVIEDTSDLVLTARVEEKDINHIENGMDVSVTPKADDSDTYEGTVQRISDSAAKNASGKTDTSGEDAEFDVTVRIAAPDEKLRIGMNAEAAFVIYRQEGCFVLANESIGRAENGDCYILTVSGEGESMQVERSVVTIVYEGRNRSVIEGEAVREGTRILTDVAEYASLADASSNNK